MKFTQTTGRISVSNDTDLYVKLSTPDDPGTDLPLIVFIHSNDVDHSVWRCQEKFFANHGYYTLSYDLRGFGQSSRPQGPLTPEVHLEDLQTLLTKLNLKKVMLVGWALGGIIAQAYTLKYPEKVVFLIIVSSTPCTEQTEIFPYGKTPLQHDLERLLIMADFQQYLSRKVMGIIPVEYKSENAYRIREYLASLIRQTGLEIALRQSEDLREFNTIQQLSEITVPSLIIFGSNDLIVDSGAALFMRANMPNVYLFEFPEAGHAPFLTCKTKFNQTLLRLIETSNLQCSDFCKSLVEDSPQ